jgi:hypothetical protein
MTTNHVGTAALGCPVERSSTVFPETRNRRALLRRTAGGYPHVADGDSEEDCGVDVFHNYVQMAVAAQIFRLL